MEDLDQNDILPLQNLIFKDVNSMYKLQYNHFNQCMEDMIPRMLKELKCPKKGLIGPWNHKYAHFSGISPRIGFL